MVCLFLIGDDFFPDARWRIISQANYLTDIIAPFSGLGTCSIFFFPMTCFHFPLMFLQYLTMNVASYLPCLWLLYIHIINLIANLLIYTMVTTVPKCCRWRQSQNLGLSRNRVAHSTHSFIIFIRIRIAILGVHNPFSDTSKYIQLSYSSQYCMLYPSSIPILSSSCWISPH